MIVKDEEEALPACLSALRPFVDEIVVYDTGSSDATVEVARAHGARVVLGWWDDNFGAARQRALSHCSTDWVLVVDADEIVQGDPSRLRAYLDAEPADAATLLQVSTSWAGATGGSRVQTARLARRGRVQWLGRLHEQLVPAFDGDLVRSISDAPIQLIHSGYRAGASQSEGRKKRNLDLATTTLAEIPPGDPRRAKAVADYGRSLYLSGDPEAAVAAMDELRSQSRGRETVMAGRVCLQALVPRRRLDEAAAWIDAMEVEGESRGTVAMWRAHCALIRGDPAEARQHLDRLALAASGSPDVDAWGVPFEPEVLLGVEAAIDMMEGRFDAAVRTMAAQAKSHPHLVSLSQLVAALSLADGSWENFIRDASGEFLEASLRAAPLLEPESGLRWCEAFLTAHPEAPGPLVAGCIIAARSNLPDAMTWSLAARRAGLPDLCPLRRRAEQEDQSVLDQALLWALLADSFGEDDAMGHFHSAVVALPDNEVPILTNLMVELTPTMASQLFGAGDEA